MARLFQKRRVLAQAPLVLLLAGCSLLGGDEDVPWDTDIPESEAFEADLGEWSPDGKRIAFQHNAELTEPNPGLLDQLWIADLETGERHMVHTGRVLALDWSPDGEWFAFHSFSDPEYLFKVDVNGQRLTRLTGEDSPNPDLRYTVTGNWSPSGDRLLYTVVAGEPRGISVMNPDGSDTQLLVPYGIQGSWFPDGERIIYVNWDPAVPEATGRARQVYTANADGTGIRKLTDLPDSDYLSTPVLSPDGKQIAFVYGRDELHLMNVDGTDVRQVTNGEGIVGGPEWSPDGTQILFGRFIPNVSTRLYVLDVATLEVEPVFLKK